MEKMTVSVIQYSRVQGIESIYQSWQPLIMSNETKLKVGFEEPPKDEHRIRITLSSKNVKNLEKVCADLVRGAERDFTESQGTSENAY
ncbi:hypothetical protein IFM89_018645 [Coptis chinensis]|uniref:Uncharacterized protein n=1 Tax=Coptis chinensis TaxID=261450 RepID=A0A835HTS6_9MAGN|nr:hypothetical protein IFM89_018645 [Coptis chinensis]